MKINNKLKKPGTYETTFEFAIVTIISKLKEIQTVPTKVNIVLFSGHSERLNIIIFLSLIS